MTPRTRLWITRIAALVAAFWIGCSAADWADVLDGATSPDDDLSSSSGDSSGGPYGSGGPGNGPAPAYGSDAYYGDSNQPRMTSALEHLQNAKNELQQADTNKGGYRKDAIDHVDSAIEAVRNGMAYDATH